MLFDFFIGGAKLGIVKKLKLANQVLRLLTTILKLIKLAKELI